jgi:hypothetical protein
MIWTYQSLQIQLKYVSHPRDNAEKNRWLKCRSDIELKGPTHASKPHHLLHYSQQVTTMKSRKSSMDDPSCIASKYPGLCYPFSRPFNRK